MMSRICCIILQQKKNQGDRGNKIGKVLILIIVELGDDVRVHFTIHSTFICLRSFLIQS